LKYSFGAVVGNSAVNKAFNADAPSVVVFKKGEENEVISGEALSNVETAIKSAAVPLIDEISGENYKFYQDAGLPLAFLFLNTAVQGEKDNYLPKAFSVAKQTRGQISWVWLDVAKYGSHAGKMGLSGNVFPALAIDKEGLHYTYDESKPITEEGLVEFGKQFVAGTIQPTFKSEEIPATNDGPVKIVVRNNWEQIVNDASKDVLVEFYAPWCGHCKHLAPIYEQLGEALKPISSVVIAKIDATANDVDPRLGIQGFPTLKLFPANNKQAPIDYNGDRSLADLQKFIEKNASIKFESARDEL